MKKIITFTARHQRLLVVSALCLGLGLLIGWQSGSGRHCDSEPSEPACETGQACAHDAPAVDECASDEDCHAGHAHASESVDLDDLTGVSCEHAVPIVHCDDCRYEVGVVKIAPDVAGALLETGRVRRTEAGTPLRFTGQIQLDRTRTVDVVSPGSGQIKQVLKLFGEPVEKGEVLAVIHSTDFGQAKAEFLEAGAQLELVEATFKREQSLYEQKVTSQADFLDARNALKAAQASFAAAEKRLTLFGLDADAIGRISDEQQNGEFADLKLYAPQSGTVITQTISAGMMVDTIQPLYTVADLSNLWVWCDVYEKDLAALHERFSKNETLPAVIRVNAFPDEQFEGTADLIGNVMDEQTRTVKMRIQVKNPDRKLKPGLFATIQVQFPGDGEVTVVPQTAVMSDAGRHFVFQHWKDDLWARRDVTLGTRRGDHVEVLDGISAGASIVTGGAFMLKSDILREKMGAGCAD